jgi:uncharacterized repeat protein (TIGR03943 family)
MDQPFAQSGFTLSAARPGIGAWAKAVLMLGMGGYFTFVIANGTLDNYLNLRYAWLVYLAAGLFLLVGGYLLFQLVTGGRAHARAAEAGGLGGFGLARAPVTWTHVAILSIPLALGLLIPSRPLTVDAIGATGLSTSGSVAANAANVFEIAPLNRTVLDWLRAFNNTSDPAEIVGEPADVLGFVYTEPGFAEGTFMVARFTISCCVADSSAIGLPVAYDGAAALEQGAWVRIQGSMDVGEFRGDILPILRAQTLEVVPEPKNPYLYP